MLEWLKNIGSVWRVPLVLGVFSLAYLILCAGAVHRRLSQRSRDRARKGGPWDPPARP